MEGGVLRSPQPRAHVDGLQLRPPGFRGAFPGLGFRPRPPSAGRAGKSSLPDTEVGPLPVTQWRAWLAARRRHGYGGAVAAVAPDFHSGGLVLVGTEDRGLWRSADGGHSFARVDGAPDRVDALTATADGWLLSDDQGLLHSPDGLTWTRVDGATPALILLNTKDGVWAGNESGIARVEVASPA
ncbi:MAG: hypothetical protein R2854_08305 [Caldilineaceae bacterium]